MLRMPLSDGLLAPRRKLRLRRFEGGRCGGCIDTPEYRTEQERPEGLRRLLWSPFRRTLRTRGIQPLARRFGYVRVLQTRLIHPPPDPLWILAKRWDSK